MDYLQPATTSPYQHCCVYILKEKGTTDNSFPKFAYKFVLFSTKKRKKKVFILDMYAYLFP